MSMLAVTVAVIALFISLTTAGRVREAEEEKYRKNVRKPTPPPTVEERRARTVLRREHENFMNYDGTAQMPIDPDTILAESGE